MKKERNLLECVIVSRPQEKNVKCLEEKDVQEYVAKAAKARVVRSQATMYSFHTGALKMKGFYTPKIY
jgi:hypothetical protein